MEEKGDIRMKKRIIGKYSIDDHRKHSYDSIKIQAKKYKSLGKNDTMTLLNFISSKNKITFKSDFDRKGAKKFLSEKSKAMEEIVLIDYIEEETNKDNIKKNKSHHKNSHKNKNNNKNIKQHRSQNALIHLKLHKLSNKKVNLLQKKNKKNNMSSKTLSVRFINNIKDIGKINLNNNKKKASIKSIKSGHSNYNSREPSYLMTRENDSFIYTIVNQMEESKNKF